MVLFSSFEEAKRIKFDLCIVCGGNIIYTKPSPLFAYRKNADIAYPALWIGATQLAILQNIPIKYNAPGIIDVHTTFIEKYLIKKVFSYASYLSFRDAKSKEIALKYTSKNIEVVPDTAFDIAEMWPLNDLKKKGYVLINLNSRYHKPVRETAECIDEISNKTQLSIKLCIIGGCHGDLDFTLQVKKELKCESELLPTTTLKELAHSIGNANYFIGSSMHGFITSLAYKTPSLLVLKRKPMHKFQGLLDVADLKNDVIYSNWVEVINKIETPVILSDNALYSMKARLDKHWENLIENKDYQINNSDFLNLELLLKINNIPHSIKRKIKNFF